MNRSPSHVICGVTLRIHHYGAYGKVGLTPQPTGQGRAAVTQVRELCPWATVAPLSPTVVDGGGSGSPSAIQTWLACLSAYPSVQMGFGVMLSLSENEIQLQGKNC